MKITNSTIKKLLPKYKEIMQLGHINALLHWDVNVNLPPHASAERAEQSAYLTKLITNMWLDAAFRELLEKVNSEKSLTPEEKAMVRNLNYAGKYYYNVPKALIIKKEQVTSHAFLVWKQAREENNFKKFLTHLERIIDLDKQIASHLGYTKNPYDALLDLYEPELTAEECQRLFTGMKNQLVPLIKKITKSRTYVEHLSFIDGKTQYPIPEQEKILKHIVKQMGFDFSRGRVAVSPHPFTIQLGQHDVRLTTFYNQHDFRESFTSAMHEAGHGLYELGVNSAFHTTPLGGGVSLGIHEAQSRFWENMVGKNPAFLTSMYPLFRAFYSEQLSTVSESDFIRSFNLVKPSLIRIHADEVTYSLHIILRFEMENEIMNGKIAVKDAPEAWREKSKALFGIVPTTDSEGILQDVHWAYGSFGYFPAYALGNLYGAQFLHTMKKDLLFDQEIAKGNLRPVKEWFDKNVHQYGSLYFPSELVKKVTGKSLDYQYFLDYLVDKYTTLYAIA